MSLTIGKLAKLADVTIETVRYYQRIGLLIEPEKPDNGYRQYPQSAIDRIRFIKRAQQCGFTLNEIAELLTMDERRCQDVKKIAEHKRDKIKRQIKELKILSRLLNELIDSCHENQDGEHCSLIHLLSQNTADKPKSS